MIYCIMNTGKVFNSDVRTLLLLTARQMVARSRDRQTVKNNYCEGVVETHGTRAMIGTIAGQVFTAALDIASGPTLVSFLVRTQDLEDFDPNDGEWSDWMGPREFTEAIRNDHRRRALK